MAKRILVILTKDQAEQVEWALDPMADMWCTEDGAHGRDGEVFPESILPLMEPEPLQNGGKSKTRVRLWLSVNDDINSDLLYRLETQLQQMADQQPVADRKARDSSRAGRNAAMRIRSRKPSLTNLAEGGGWI